MPTSQTVTWSVVSEQSPVSIVSEARGSKAPCLYMYFDESGNLDFKPNGTPFFIMTCAVARRPFLAGQRLSTLRYDLLEGGLAIEKFHACEDVEDVRKPVYSALATRADEYGVYVAYVRKDDVPEGMRTPDAIYSRLFETIVDEVYEKENLRDVQKVIAITDSLPKDAKRRQVAAPLKRYMKARFQKSGIPYLLLHHSSSSDQNLQAVDYFCWAAHRKLTQQKDWPFIKVAGSFREFGRIGFSDET